MSAADAEPQTPAQTPALARPPARRGRPAWFHGVAAGLFLYLFLCAINVMGSGLKTIGEQTTFLQDLLAHAENPFVALMGAVLITAVVQSSSFTTSLIITLTATGVMKVETGVFAVMGANIGTSVTGIIVSFGQVRIRRQFRRAFTAALVHDIFNLLTVALLFPIEWVSSAMNADGKGLLLRFSEWVAGFFAVTEMDKPFNPVKWATTPVVWLFDTVGGLVPIGEVAQAVFIAIAGLALLFSSLVMLVANLKGALLRRIEGLFRSFFFRNDASAYAVGIVTTVLLQTSTMSTSLFVPLVGAGIVKLQRVLPFMLGANIGTTLTGVIAATANPNVGAVTVAASHVTFNLIGTLIWYPLKVVPLSLAQGYGRLAARSKRYAVFFLLTVFVIIPGVGIFITELLI